MKQNVTVESTYDSFFYNSYFVALTSQDSVFFFQNPFSHSLTLLQVWFCFSQYRAIPGVLPVGILSS